MMKKITTIILVFACAGFVFTAAAPPAHANKLIDFFFPSLRKKEADPRETLQAPFLTPDAEKPPVSDAQKGLPENSIPLEQPHRAPAAIGEWLVSAVSESMSFSPETYQADLTKTADMFDETGRAEYMKFLTDSSIMKVLESKKFHVTGFAQEMPEVVTSGPVNGAYHWLFRVPVMMSYMDRTMTDYKKAEPVSQKVILTIQVGRSLSANNENGVLIERWEGKLQGMDKK